VKLEASGGDRRWFKRRSARKKRPVTRDNNNNIIIIIIIIIIMHGQYFRNIDSLLVKKTLSYGCRWETGKQKLKVK
jgi:hypothetical protein